MATEKYSDEWLRERSASFNPLTGQKVPPVLKGSDQAKTTVPPDVDRAKVDPLGQVESVIRDAAEIPRAITEKTASPDTVSPPSSVRRAVGEGGDASSDKEYRPVRKKSSRAPLVIGMLLAIAAVVAAEHYLVPDFTHNEHKKTSSIAKFSSPATSEQDTPAKIPPNSNAAPNLPKAGSSSFPELNSKVHSVTEGIDHLYAQLISELSPEGAEKLKQNEIAWIIEKRNKCGTYASDLIGQSESGLECQIAETEKRIKYLQSLKDELGISSNDIAQNANVPSGDSTSQVQPDRLAPELNAPTNTSLPIPQKETAIAPAQQVNPAHTHNESKAQYEQQHMQQLLSPLG